jgi:preprotein translocase subunit SecF
MINFMRIKTIYFLISLLFLLPSAYFLSRFGLKPSLDFTGGALLEIHVEPTYVQNITPAHITEIARQVVELNSVQQTDTNTFLIRAQEFDQEHNQILQKELKTFIGDPTEIHFATIGPTLGKELIRKTLTGIILAAGFIMLYVSFRFKDKKYGVCAILAMLHDSLILLGVFSFLGQYRGIEVDALFVTALLTILSFSVHDTIVVYDRIRESLKQHPQLSFTNIVNQAVTQTLGRSVNNSLTIIFMLLSLYLLGGTSIKWFIFALLIGTISGTYSSTFTAAPLLVLWENLKARKTKPTP